MCVLFRVCGSHVSIPGSRFPGLTRGLVAVLLYHDGRRCLVSSLRSLVQAREGVAWTLGESEVWSVNVQCEKECLLGGVCECI